MWSCSRVMGFLLISSGFVAAACNDRPAPFEADARPSHADRAAPFDPPRAYPAWAYDQPEYVYPAERLEPEVRLASGDPLHYYTADNVVMVSHPNGDASEETPRVAIWWTGDNGLNWHKSGYFGLGQSYFPFEAVTDGDFGIRFIGPGQSPAEHAPAYPERVYHVDTTEPEVEVTIDPVQGWYNVGQLISLSWRASDYHLSEYPVRISLLKDYAISEQESIELQRDLAPTGSINYEIPLEALDHEIVFRVEAIDRACNLGMAFSHPLQIVAAPTDRVGHDDDASIVGLTTHEDELLDDDSTMEEIKEMIAVDIAALTEDSKPEIAKDASPRFRRWTTILADTSADLKEAIWEFAALIEAGVEEDAEHFVDDQDNSFVTDAGGDEPPVYGMDEPLDESPGQFAEARMDTIFVSERSESEFAFEEEGESGFVPALDSTTSGSTLIVGSSRPVPFATAVARLPNADSDLLWAGSESGASEFTESELASNQGEGEEWSDVDVNPMTPVEPVTPEVVASRTVELPVQVETTDVRDVSDVSTVEVETVESAPIMVAVSEPGPEPEPEPEPKLDSRSSVIDRVPGDLSSIDLTYGNGMLIPLPATVGATQPRTVFATAHPWRALGRTQGSLVRTVWSLPEQRQRFGRRSTFKGRFLADHPTLRTVAEPAESTRVFAGTVGEAVGGDAP